MNWEEAANWRCHLPMSCDNPKSLLDHRLNSSFVGENEALDLGTHCLLLESYQEQKGIRT
jgi:hypothetical protein